MDGSGSSDLHIITTTEADDCKDKIFRSGFKAIGISFIVCGLFINLSGLVMDSLGPAVMDYGWMRYVYDVHRLLLCSAFLIGGLLSIIYSSKLRSTVYAFAMFLLMLTVFGICIYSIIGYAEIKGRIHYKNTQEINSWRNLKKHIEEKTCPTNDQTNEDELCVFLCNRLAIHPRGTYGSYDSDSIDCTQICLQQNQFCDGVLDLYPHPVNQTTNNISKRYFSYCNETDDGNRYNNHYNYRYYDYDRISFADEMNCDLYVDLLNASLLTNIALSGVGLFTALMICIFIGKSMPKMLLFLYKNFNTIVFSILPYDHPNNSESNENYEEQGIDLSE